MPDDHRALAQRCGEPRALMRAMTRKDEIGGRWQHLEAETEQSAGQPLAAFDDARPALLKLGFVLKRSDGAGLREPAERIGVETVLDPGERLDQLGVADRIADPQAGQRPGF